MPRNLLALRKDSSLYHYVLISWEKPPESSEFPLLYFSIRYKDTGNKWIYAGELLIDEDKVRYSYKFYTLELDTTYVVEVYAGNILGLGKPVKTVIRLPRMGKCLVRVDKSKTHTHRHTDRHKQTHTGRHTDRYTDRHTDTDTGRHTQADTHRHRQTDEN